MKKAFTFVFIAVLVLGGFHSTTEARSYTSDSYYYSGNQGWYDFYGRTPQSTQYYYRDYYYDYDDYYDEDYIESLIDILESLLRQLEDLQDEHREDRRDRRYEDPDVDTQRAQDIEDDRAELNGDVDMNDFRNGRVFFVYGEDEDQVEDIEDDYDEYRDIDEDGDDLQKITVDTDHDGRDDFSKDVAGLDDDTMYYFSICVEYEDEDDDERIICGGVEDFETDKD